MKTHDAIAKFWPRIGALVIDMIIIGIFGIVIGLVFEDFLVSIGEQGLLLGLCITLIYFSIGNSYLTKGQTVGKKILSLKTINKKGELLTVKNTVLRALIFLLPFFLINYPIPGVKVFSVLNVYKSSILLSVLAGSIILYLTNISSRQSLHDWILRTYVVNQKDNDQPTSFPPNNKTGIYLFAGIIVLVLGLSTYNLFKKENISHEFEQVVENIRNINGILGVGTSHNTTTFYGSEKRVTQSYNLILHVRDLPEAVDFEESEIVKEAVKILFQVSPEVKELDFISIKINRGFNIGIARKNYSYLSSKSPDEWIEIID